jgi:hypothetical protein
MMKTPQPAKTIEGACRASPREYRKVAADCARLALAAPGLQARAGFATAAKSWLTLAQLAGEDSMRADKESANGAATARRA